MLMSYGLNRGKNHNTNRDVILRNVAELKYFASTLQNKLVHISKLRSGKIWRIPTIMPSRTFCPRVYEVHESENTKL